LNLVIETLSISLRRLWAIKIKKHWDSKIKYALWVDCITTKTYTRKIPFESVYRMEENFPINLLILVFHILQHFTENQEPLQRPSDQLIELDESRIHYVDQMVSVIAQVVGLEKAEPTTN
jgi:hypothetical protein